MRFGDVVRIGHALAGCSVSRHAKVKARYHTVDADNKTIGQVVDTTPGRMLLSEVLPRHPKVPFSLLNKVLTKKEITELIDIVYRHCGQKDTVIFCDRLMTLGFGYACKPGISFGQDDLMIPEIG